jgi:TolB-like protein
MFKFDPGIDTMKVLRLMITLLPLALLCSCGAPSRTFVNGEADFGFYTKVGVIPFSNLSADRNASEKVTAAFVTELLIGGKVQVANMGDMLTAFKGIVKDDRTNLPEQLRAEEAKAVGTTGDVQGIIVGAVREYGMVRSGQEDFPLVSLSVRLVDCQSGKVVWTYEITRKGGPKMPIFSFGETHTLGDMAAKVCREAAGSLLSTLK